MSRPPRVPRRKSVPDLRANSGATLVNGVVLIAEPCIVFRIHCAHGSGSAGWIQVHDSATVPADGTVPQQVHAVAANNDADIETAWPLYYENGLYVCESDTIATKTLTTPSDNFFFVEYALWSK